MNLWHGVSPERVREDDFIAVIEISKGTKNKYEMDKETGCLMLDRVLYTSTHYPANYGFIPRTFAEDNDPLDAIVVCSEVIAPMSLVRCYPIGAIRMKDNNENDDKLIAIPFTDPSFNHIKSINDLSPHVLDEFMHFFKVYKQLENKKTANISILDIDKATVIFRAALERYRAKFCAE